MLTIVALKRPCSLDSKQPNWSVVNLKQQQRIYNFCLINLLFQRDTPDRMVSWKREYLETMEATLFLNKMNALAAMN